MTSGDPLPEHSRDDPPWSWCGDRRTPDFGCVFASPAARGAVALTFDRRGRHHALTLFAPMLREAQIDIFGRRFDIVWDASSADGA
jgi:hypothetical protein